MPCLPSRSHGLRSLSPCLSPCLSQGLRFQEGGERSSLSSLSWSFLCFLSCLSFLSFLSLCFRSQGAESSSSSEPWDRRSSSCLCQGVNCRLFHPKESVASHPRRTYEAGPWRRPSGETLSLLSKYANLNFSIISFCTSTSPLESKNKKFKTFCHHLVFHYFLLE